ncbi:ABC transporter substrate-binding protein [Sphaerotilus montanus]|uniref:ABC-type branched-subunit amino acid transport system substrate-binding protein n=1 Tax=Sphaerotilus montanus TaxID=522889 RepID=A0A7Y9U900_9BURK|nr:ABC transporter substrate-binding protein [Sphaerotilus montanus]NYG35457.1 ABC-type branched-subunit amino acid transport system substrate-binding protein [Sphaerotilus montanus]NZD57204.1 ABC transporter substrate-binding protein [Sphaerotilus montanus]
MKRLLVMAAAVAVGLFVWSHWPAEDYAALADARDQHALDTQADIVVAAVADPQQSDYVKGIELAVTQLNERPEKLLGRLVRLRIEQGSADPVAENRLVQRLVSDERVVAVLGHRASSLAVPASLVYEAARMVFLPPFATKKSLTGHDFQYVFRMAPSSPVMAEQLASLTALLGHGRVAVLHARDDYSRELAFLFEDSAVARGVRVTQRASFLATDEDYRSLVAQLRAKPFDAVFLSASSGPGARMVQQLRELGVQVPIIGIDSMNSREFKDAAGAAGHNIITPVLYRSNQTGWRNAAFVERFRAAHGREPDHNAAQGYDSMLLLARAIELAKTTRTSAVQSALRFMPYWIGVTGLHAFDARGELRAKRYEFQQLLAGEWQPLPGLHLRYQLERAEAEARLTGEPLPAGFSQSFRAEASLEETATLQFEMARRILPIQRLGVLIASRDPDTLEEVTQQVQRLAKATGVAIEHCVMRDEALDDDLAHCLQTLTAPSPSQPQALMLARFDDLSFVDTVAVGAKLRAAPLPVFAISAAGNRVMPPGLAVFVDEVGRQDYFGPAVKNIERMVARQVVDGVIGGLVNLPAVKVDLQRLLALGHQSNPALLNLFAEEMPPVAATFALPKQARQPVAAPEAASAASEAASADAAASAPDAASAASTPTSAPSSAPLPASAPSSSSDR